MIQNIGVISKVQSSMKQILKITIRITGLVVLVLLFSFLSLLAFLHFTEFKPVSLSADLPGGGIGMPEPGKVITFFSWNIGYAGMGKEMDFFYDGGHKVRQSKLQTLACLTGIRQVIGSYDTIPFIFLQEVDRCSKRSWDLDEFEEISTNFPGHTKWFSKNYECRFVPVPLANPMGRVLSGITTFSKFQPVSWETRYYYSDFPWPMRLVMLKRCFNLFRFPLHNKKDLIVVNLHNSAYDSTGILREKELMILDSTLNTEYRKGNFIVAGGDWNINPKGLKTEWIRTKDVVMKSDPPFPEHILTGWQFVFDPGIPSERYTDEGYLKGRTRTTILDFFVVSPNIRVLGIETADLGFKWSDHNPVIMKVILGNP